MVLIYEWRFFRSRCRPRYEQMIIFYLFIVEPKRIILPRTGDEAQALCN